ncbi:MAG: Coenzyme F420 hydrogenase/dehydrogenase, beta subunit C-terminal domain [Promethearchaeota archaeon]
MCPETKVSMEFLKNVSETLDSYRVRALIDAKKDILEAGIYSESQYYDILFRMFDDELLKYSLYNYLKHNQNNNLKSLLQFSKKNSIEFKKVYSLLELLKNEKLVIVEEQCDKIEGNEDSPPKEIFKDLLIKVDEVKSIDSIKSIYEPVKVIFDAKICSGCGMCAGICPVNCLNIFNGFGQIDEDKCIRCGLCYFVCPRSYLPTRVLNIAQENTSEIKDYSEIGFFRKAFSARTKIKEIAEVCQDGGISSTTLYYLFDKKKIEIALGAKMSRTLWRPEPLLIKSKDEILLTAGTKYVNNPTLKVLNELNGENRAIAIVGVPCMMQALLKSEIYNLGFPTLNNVKYRIGIFCMESFSYDSLLKICEILKVDVNDVKKMDINKGKFFVYTNNGDEFNVPIKEISHLAREDCEICYDLTSESADISIGSIGSPAGWNTVIIRTEKGKKLYDDLVANDLVESKPIEEIKPGLPILEKIAGSKRSKSNKHIIEKKNENKRFPFY